MFRTNKLEEVVARRTGRIAFGVVLVAGAAALVNQPRVGVSAAAIVIATWIIAFAAATFVRFLVPWHGPHEPTSRFAPSIVVPSVGIALLLPLTLQLPFVAIGMAGAAAFDEWVHLSLIVVGATHVAFALLVAIRGSQLVAGKRSPLSPLTIFTSCVIVSCIPFALILIPPILVAVTGLVFLPLMRYQAELVARERAELELDAVTPRAIVYVAA